MRGGASGGVLEAAADRARSILAGAGRELAAEGMPVPEWRGKVIRPVLGLAGVGWRPEGEAGGAEAQVLSGQSSGSGGEGAWEASRLARALAAVQLAHEASLLHDDVIDGADRRRGEPTMVAARGVAAALVEGDHLLTSAYRAAASVGSPEWTDLFARAVERTVAGEKAQARAVGGELDWSEYEAVVLGKSGELMGAALAAGPVVRGAWDAHRYYEVGRRVGLLYQMLDDLLDYCVHLESGKPTLSDYRRGLWTWPRLYLELEPGLEESDVEAALRRPGGDGRTPLERCVVRYRAEADAVRGEVAELLPGDRVLAALLDRWVARAEAAVPSRPRVTLPPVGGWEELMSEHARSFQFAARLFPSEQRARVVGLYAWCRYTDDLVDGVDAPAEELEARLDAWLDLSRRAYGGEATGNPLADRVMAEMRSSGVPFGYAEELIEGMRMDVRGVRYATVAELWRYTYRVASVVGLWMTELFGIRDPWLLDRAASLGHAMQLTNMLRDVGEDLEAGRLYLPTVWLQAYGLDQADLERMARTGEIDDRYRALIERLLQVAEREYDLAAPAIRRLPDFYRRPVAVAADVYRGIHDAIRANGYDNLTRRAYTGLTTKLRLGAGALLRSRPATPLPGSPARVAALGAAAALATALLLAAGAAAQEPAPAAVSPVESTRADGGALPGRVTPVRITTPVDRALERIGGLWLLAVDDAGAVDVGLDAIAALRNRTPGPSPDLDRLLRAYEGSFTAVRAKHGGWPTERLRNLREGFALMDAAVAADPGSARLRYVRLMSGFHLPSIFGRGEEVEADLSALTRLLPAQAESFPPALVPEVATFLLEHGSPAPDQRRRLEALAP